MKKKTQRDWVTAQLIKKGKISRNEALKRYITRLGAIICDIKAETELEIVGGYVSKNGGKDYVYKLWSPK